MEKICPFCDRSQIEERIVAEDDACYVIATLGQITEGGYVLVIPKKHISCMGALDREQIIPSLNRTKDACRALSLEYQRSAVTTPYPVTVFEHGIVGQTIQHAHLHLLPAVIDLTSRIRADFPTARIEELQYAGHLQELFAISPKPYLFWTVPNGRSMVCWAPAAPPQYLRIITADLLHRQDRANWRQMDSQLDRNLWTSTVTRLKPYLS